MIRSPRNFSAILVSLLLAAAVCGGGCAAVDHYGRRLPSPPWILPHRQDTAGQQTVCAAVPMFYGHRPTCWRPWPEGWIVCPEYPTTSESADGADGRLDANGAEVLPPLPGPAEPVPPPEKQPDVIPPAAEEQPHGEKVPRAPSGDDGPPRESFPEDDLKSPFEDEPAASGSEKQDDSSPEDENPTSAVDAKDTPPKKIGTPKPKEERLDLPEHPGGFLPEGLDDLFPLDKSDDLPPGDLDESPAKDVKKRLPKNAGGALPPPNRSPSQAGSSRALPAATVRLRLVPQGERSVSANRLRFSIGVDAPRTSSRRDAGKQEKAPAATRPSKRSRQSAPHSAWESSPILKDVRTFPTIADGSGGIPRKNGTPA